MWKSIAVLSICFIVTILVVIVLQPSPQETALANLDAAEKILDQTKISETPAAFEKARKTLATLKLPDKDQEAAVSQALAGIDELEGVVEGDRTRLNAISSEVKSQINQAHGNLSNPSALERARNVKDQLLSLLWLFLIALLILYLVHSKASLALFQKLAGLISNVKVPGGLEISFATAVKSDQEQVLKSYRQQVITTYDNVSKQHQIAETVSRIAKGRIQQFLNTLPAKPEFRCTLHVRDILFDNSLYQLIDYVGKKGGGRGRAWSIRRGMIGRCWRLEQSDAKDSIPKDENSLVDQWALTRDELEGANKNQTILCHLIKATNESPLALFYMDAESKGAFGDENKMRELMGIIEDEIKRLELDESLEQVWQQVKQSAPLIEIYDDHFTR